MLTLLQGDERVTLQAQLDQAFPAQLLQLIAAHPGYQEHQLYSWMATWYGAHDDTRLDKEWVAAALDWFLHEGHVQREPGGRYVCLPSYVLGGTPELEGRAWLCGHPAAQYILDDLGVALETNSVSELSSDGRSQRVGFDRSLKLTPQQRSNLEGLGIRCFAADDLTAALPNVQFLRPFEPNEAQPLPVLNGVWHIYQPAYTDGEPWQPLVREPQAGQLARWMPRDDWQGVREARYFYCSWGRSGVPLAYNEVALWQLHLAADAGHPRRLYWHAAQRTLILPLGLPAILWQWLKLAAVARPRRQGLFYHLPIGSSDIRTLRDILETRFQLQWVAGKPGQS